MFQGSESKTQFIDYLEPAFFSDLPVYYVQPQCASNSTFSFPLQIGPVAMQKGSIHGQVLFPLANNRATTSLFFIIFICLKSRCKLRSRIKFVA